MPFPCFPDLPTSYTFQEADDGWWQAFHDGQPTGRTYMNEAAARRQARFWLEAETAAGVALDFAQTPLESGSAVATLMSTRLTRAQYEQACEELDVAARTEMEIVSYGEGGDPFMETNDAQASIAMCLRHARRRGQTAEVAAAQQAASQALRAADLALPAYTRAQYEAACRVTGAAITYTDAECTTAAKWPTFRFADAGLAVPPVADVSAALARRRAKGAEGEQAGPVEQCDNCGRVTGADAMWASFGIACSVDCYELLSERPPRGR